MKRSTTHHGREKLCITFHDESHAFAPVVTIEVTRSVPFHSGTFKESVSLTESAARQLLESLVINLM